MQALAHGLAGDRQVNRVLTRFPVDFGSNPQRPGPASARNRSAVSVKDPDLNNERRNPADRGLPPPRKDILWLRGQGCRKLVLSLAPKAADRG
jgi:hypothetical protein